MYLVVSRCVNITLSIVYYYTYVFIYLLSTVANNSYRFWADLVPNWLFLGYGWYPWILTKMQWLPCILTRFSWAKSQKNFILWKIENSLSSSTFVKIGWSTGFKKGHVLTNVEELSEFSIFHYEKIVRYSPWKFGWYTS